MGGGGAGERWAFRQARSPPRTRQCVVNHSRLVLGAHVGPFRRFLRDVKGWGESRWGAWMWSNETISRRANAHLRDGKGWGESRWGAWMWSSEAISRRANAHLRVRGWVGAPGCQQRQGGPCHFKAGQSQTHLGEGVGVPGCEPPQHHATQFQAGQSQTHLHVGARVVEMRAPDAPQGDDRPGPPPHRPPQQLDTFSVHEITRRLG